MEHLRSIAVTYYLASSEEIQKRVDEFIAGLDKDGNGEVDCYEFKQSLKEQGYEEYANSDLFEKLDINGDKGLDFSELIALYYIILSGRPFCYQCKMFIMAEYFVCKECFENSTAPFYLCPSCYQNGYYKKHSHENAAVFLDTYAMLESQRLSALTTKKQGQKVVESPSQAMVRYSPSPSPSYSPSPSPSYSPPPSYYSPSSSSYYSPYPSYLPSPSYYSHFPPYLPSPSYYSPSPSSYYSPSPSSSLAIVSSSITTAATLKDSIGFKVFECALSIANLKVGLLSLGISACTIM